MSNLSDKMCQYDPHQNGYFEEDVKTFIKELKETMTKLGAKGHEVIIDHLAGDKLIKEAQNGK